MKLIESAADRRVVILSSTYLVMCCAISVAGEVFLRTSTVLADAVRPSPGLWGHNFLATEVSFVSDIQMVACGLSLVAFCVVMFAIWGRWRRRNMFGRLSGLAMLLLSLVAALPVFHVLIDAHTVQNREKSQAMARTMTDAIASTVMRDGGTEADMERRLSGARDLISKTAEHAFAYAPRAVESNASFVRFMQLRSRCSAMPTDQEDCALMKTMEAPEIPSFQPQVDGVRVLLHLLSPKRRAWDAGSLALGGPPPAEEGS